MKLTFKKSNHVALLTKDFDSASKFYSKVLQLPIQNATKNEIEYRTGDSCFYVIRDKNLSTTVLEFIVDDLECTKNHLFANGCEIVKWEGKGKDCYMRDPFGLVFNIWEEKEIK